MNNNSKLIVMLTSNDRTVENAHEIFRQCKNSKADIWGIKEKGLPKEQMKNLFSYMKECGKSTVLEVVAYKEQDCMKGAEMAVLCGCDILMGTVFYDSVNSYCKKNGLKYMPYVGQVEGRPSVLNGSPEKIIEDAKRYLEQGVYGISLLGYRYVGNAEKMMDEFLSKINSPVCVAGSIDCYEKLDNIKRTAPWAFTIGSAFFQKRFGEAFDAQIDKVFRYINEV